MKSLSQYIDESVASFLGSKGNVEFDIKQSEIKCDRKTTKGYIYSKDLEIKEYADNTKDALSMIETASDESKFYFLSWSKALKVWETASATFYYQKGSGKNVLVSTDGNDVTEEKLKNKMEDKFQNTVLVKV